MNYDVWGSWSSAVGPNSPLNDTCASPADQVGSAVSAVKAWTAAGVPVDQIVLGVASYGHSFSVPPYDALAGNNLLHTRSSTLRISHSEMHGTILVVLMLVVFTRNPGVPGISGDL
ncbi:hypothetical protein J3R83DRAFT_3733 [Lanmaoa asiatica]|nr:hypothetical protein J3R83DRAFT_3733 [Lanmaoa asiatica]